MNRARLLFIVIILITFISMFSGCTEDIINGINTEKQDEEMVILFNAFEDGEYSIVQQLIPNISVENNEHEKTLNYLTSYIDGHVIDYKKIGYFINTSTNSEGATIQNKIVYRVMTEDTSYVVTMILQQIEETDHIVVGFYVITSKDYELNGAIINFEEFNIFQLLPLLLTAACLGIIICAIIVCAKSKIRLKALWIVLILLLQMGFSITNMPSGYNFKLLLFAFDISSLRVYLDGSTILTILFPIGAILFLCLKKRLINSAQKHAERQANIDQLSAVCPAPVDVTNDENLSNSVDDK